MASSRSFPPSCSAMPPAAPTRRRLRSAKAVAQPMRGGKRLMGEINVVPYIDVMLVLLIIFMITAPLLTQGVKVDLPKAGAEPLEAQRNQPLVLSVDRQGRLFLNIGGNPQTPLDEQTVGARAAALLTRHPE